MIGFTGNRRIMLYSQPVDFRKGVDGLAALVQLTLKVEPFLRRRLCVPVEAGEPGQTVDLGR